MKRMILLTMSMIWLALPLAAQDRSSWMADPESTGIRDVQMSARDKKPVTIFTKIRVNTTIVFPDDEKVMKKTCGDADLWVIEPKDNDPQLSNIILVKPTALGQETNLTVVTTKGVYVFWLKSVKGTPDLRVAVLTDSDGVIPARKWVPVAEFDAIQAQLIEARAKIEALQTQVTEIKPVTAATAEPVKHYDYGQVPYREPFNVKAIYRDDRFTYIETDASEMPAVFELKDGKPSVLDPHVENGMITIYKIVKKGRLMLGKERYDFEMVRGN